MKKNYLTNISSIFSITLILIYLIFIIFVGYTFNSMKSNYDDSIIRDFEDSYSMLETKIEIFKNISKLSFKNNAIKDYVIDTELNKQYSYILVKDQISLHCETLTPLFATMAITDLKDKVITLNSIVSTNEYLKEFPISTKLFETADENGIITNVNPSYYTFIFKYRYYGENIVYCIINVEKKYFLPANSNGMFEIAYNNMNNSFENPKMSKAISNLDGLNSWQSTKRNGVLLRGSQYIKNMTYLYEPQQKKTHYQFLFLSVVLFAILLILRQKIIEWLSSIFYKPLHNVFDVLGYPDNSGDMELLSNSVNKLIRDNRTLRINLDQSNSDLRNAFINNWLHGIGTDDIFAYYAEKFNITCFDSDCLCIVIDCSNNESIDRINYIENMDTIQNNCAELLKKFLADNSNSELVSIDKFKFAFITNTVSKTFLTNKLLTLQDVFNDLMGYYPFIAVGRTTKSASEIYKSFDDAWKIVSRKFNYAESFLVYFDNLPTIETSFYYPIELENKLIESILYSKIEKTNEIISELINTNLYKLSLSKESLSEFKFAVTATIKRIVHMLNKTTAEIFGEDNIIYLDISSASNNEEISQNIRNIINKLVAFTSNKLKANHNKLISDILDYIADNYNRDISLNDLSEHFCKTPSQITRILNQHAGVSFKEYLNKKRVEEAKKLLLDSDITTDKISENVGYSNTRTFYRVFKNYTGYSPTEFRRISKNSIQEQKGM